MLRHNNITSSFYCRAAALTLALLLSFPCPVRIPQQLQEHSHTLAPQIAGQRVFGTQEASQEQVEQYLSNILERSQKPIIIFDKNGTVTPHKEEISIEMAERIVLLAANGCRIFLLSTNHIQEIRTQVTDILLNKALPLINERLGSQSKPELDASVLCNMVICPMSGAEVWNFDPKDRVYVQDYDMYVNNAYFRQVRATTETMRKILLEHPLYAIPATSRTRDMKKQVTLSAMRTQNVKLEIKKNFHAADTDFKETFGRSKREVWRAALKELFVIYDLGQQHDLSLLLKRYATICNSGRGGRSGRFAKIMTSPRFSKFRDMTMTDILFDMLEIRDGICHALRTARRRKHALAHALGRIAPEEAEQRARIKMLLEYWTENVSAIENLSPENLQRHITAIRELAVLVDSYKTQPATRPHQKIFIEIGGDTSVDIKFSNKGVSIDRILGEFEVDGDNVIYFGDEFTLHRGDASTIISQAGMLVNVGRPIDLSQVPAGSKLNFMCTMPFAGPNATGRLFDRILEMFETRADARIQSAA